MNEIIEYDYNEVGLSEGNLFVSLYVTQPDIYAIFGGKICGKMTVRFEAEFRFDVSHPKEHPRIPEKYILEL